MTGGNFGLTSPLENFFALQVDQLDFSDGSNAGYGHGDARKAAVGRNE